jgi:hypothetical protein
MNVEIICTETEAFYQLVDKIMDYAKSKIPKHEEEWVDSDIAMSILGIGTTTLQKYRDQNLIRVSRLSKKHIMYHRPSLIQFLENNVKDY